LGLTDGGWFREARRTEGRAAVFAFARGAAGGLRVVVFFFGGAFFFDGVAVDLPDAGSIAADFFLVPALRLPAVFRPVGALRAVALLLAAGFAFLLTAVSASSSG